MFVAGSAAALYYSRLGLALSHYDARAHLVVARRIFDSMVPGWQQVGAVWLPLPHLLNMLPVQLDVMYRTGASAIAISVMSMTLAAWALARLIFRTTGSASGAAAGALLLLANPNVLYLQSTPMTEPLLFAMTLLSIAMAVEYADSPTSAWPHRAGFALAALSLTRYEGWPIVAAVVACTSLVLLRRGTPLRQVALATGRLAVYPAVAVLVFLLNSRWTIGHWFVSGGFFVAENEARGHGWIAWGQVREEVYRLSGRMLVWSAYLSAASVVAAYVFSRARASLLLILAPAAAAALPWYAYLQGHPQRIRYGIPLVVAASALCGAGIGLLPKWVRTAAAVTLVAGIVGTTKPIDLQAPMVLEAQRDAVNRAGRRAVTAYLVRHYDGESIMMSMGSLAHYMQDLSAQGFAIRDFLHEGNGELWVFALELGPHGFAEWVVVEEQAEGGDAIFLRAQERKDFFSGFDRVAQGGGVALYRQRR